MNVVLKAGLTSAALLMTAAATLPSQAADFGGSLKDHGYVAPMPSLHRSAAGPCYVRADVGAAIAGNAGGSWPVFNEVFNDIPGDNAGADTVIDQGEIDYQFEGDTIQSASLENTWLAEVGAGCGSGSRGFRGEITFGFRGKQDFDGVPQIYLGTILGQPEGSTPDDVDDPIFSSVQSHTVMANVFYDFGVIRGFVPYVGAGIGAAYHEVDEVFFTENPNLTNRIQGNENVSFAWAVMAGLGYQISDRAILDVGYRYIDMGKAKSGRVDNAGFLNPALELDDLTAHEIKVGLRYHFGGASERRFLPLK
ncbi:MAG: opacity family porin [Pseudomonadota bacterium]